MLYLLLRRAHTVVRISENYALHEYELKRIEMSISHVLAAFLDRKEELRSANNIISFYVLC